MPSYFVVNEESGVVTEVKSPGEALDLVHDAVEHGDSDDMVYVIEGTKLKVGVTVAVTLEDSDGNVIMYDDDTDSFYPDDDEEEDDSPVVQSL